MTAPTDSGKPDKPTQPAGTPVPPRGGKKKPNRPSAARTATAGRTSTAGRSATAGRTTAAGRPASGRPGAAGTKSGGSRTTTNRRQAEWQARRRRNITLSAVAVGVVIVIIGVFVVVKATGGSSKKNSSTVGATHASGSNLSLAEAGVSALPASASKVLNVPIAALAAASKGTTIKNLTGGSVISKQPPLVSGGKPEVLYIGAEFCPYCAAERWAVVAALAKFGTFTTPAGLQTLGSTASSGTDLNPNTPTFSFYQSTYTSNYIVFSSVETTTQDETVALQTPTAAQNKLWKALDPNGTIPFIDFGNKYLISGATYTSTSMANQSFDSVAAQVGNNNTTVGKGIDQSAGAMVKAICQLTDNQPSNVCSAIGS